MATLVFQRSALAREDSEREGIEDMGKLTEEHPEFWDVIAYKVFQ